MSAPPYKTDGANMIRQIENFRIVWKGKDCATFALVLLLPNFA